ncbi:PTPA-domain-containing protein [Wallemia mellicola]|nr:PTPA-domain-containing protein [Wallemia mellicola]TIB94572.1 PTPA-domain-containing protein [Wallemia mellicola]
MDSPQRRIFTESDVYQWTHSKAYTRLIGFIQELNSAVVDRAIDIDNSDELTGLEELDSWIDDIKPIDTPQRYGNIAFRDWGSRLEQNADRLIKRFKVDADASNQLKPTLLNAFGSFGRIDYGTGHELSFIVILLMLKQMGLVQSEHYYKLVSSAFVTYLKLVTRLQLAYKLEPAGSHGVWGLDDYCFMPYIFGSSQLKGSDRHPSQLFQKDTFPTPNDNLYALAVTNIAKFKSGPWHEHSPQIYTIAHTVPNWAKVNKGMLKMFDAEVLKKRVVVQHLLFSSLFPFERDPLAEFEDYAQPQVTRLPSANNTGLPSSRLQRPTTTSDTLLPPLLPRSERKKQNQTLSSSGSAAAITSPFGVLSKPS